MPTWPRIVEVTVTLLKRGDNDGMRVFGAYERATYMLASRRSVITSMNMRAAKRDCQVFHAKIVLVEDNCSIPAIDSRLLGQLTPVYTLLLITRGHCCCVLQKQRLQLE